MPQHAIAQPNLAERRLTNRLLGFWVQACRDRLMPEEADLDPEALADIWSKCFLIQNFDLKRDHFVYSYLGEEIIDAYQDGMMTEGQSMLISPNAEKMVLSFNQVIRTGAPVVSEGEFITLAGRLIRYRQCLLPIGSGEDVHSIFGGMSFKSY